MEMHEIRALIDVDSRTWKGVRAYLEQEIERARTALEATGLGSEASEHYRGDIQRCRALLRLPETAPTGFVDETSGYTTSHRD